MNSIRRFGFPNKVFNSVGKVVFINKKYGVIEFHIADLNAGFAVFYLDNFYINNRATCDITEVYNCLSNNLHVYFDGNHILFHPSLKNETKELPEILNVLYITTKVWVGLRPSINNDYQQKLNVVNVLKAILPQVFKLSISENFNYHYGPKSSDLDNLSISDAAAYVIEIINNESGVLKICVNSLFTYALFNINILYIDGIKCDSSKLLKEFVTAGMTLHCNAKRMDNTFGNYVVTCVWSGRKPTSAEVFHNIVSNYNNDLKLIGNAVYVGIVLQLHPPDFALLMTSDSQQVSFVILFIANFRLSETQPFIHKGNWIDDFLDLSDILFFKVGTNKVSIFNFASEAWFPGSLEVNGYKYMVFDDMNVRKSLSWIDKEFSRITKHIVRKNNINLCKIPEHIAIKVHRRINKPLPKCAELPPISENDEMTSPSIEDKDINTNLCTRSSIFSDNLNVESKTYTEIGLSTSLEMLKKSVDETSDEYDNSLKHKVSKIKVTKENAVFTNDLFYGKKSNSKQSNDLSISDYHPKNDMLINESYKSMPFECDSKKLPNYEKNSVFVNQPSKYNTTTLEPQIVNKLNSKGNYCTDFEKNTVNGKYAILKKKVRFNINSSENNEENISVQHSPKSINEPVCNLKNCTHSKPGKANFTLSCGTFISLDLPYTGCLMIQPDLKILFDINVLYKCGKPCDTNHKLLDHITNGQKLNYIVSTLGPDKHVAWGVWYGPEIPEDINIIKSLLTLPNEKLKIIANKAWYYATVVKLSPPIGSLLSVQIQKQSIPVVLLAENLYCDDSGHQTVNCMMDHLLVGDTVEVKVKKTFVTFLQSTYFYWEAAEAWKRMSYASELSKRKSIALKGPYYLHIHEEIKKKKKTSKKGQNSSKLGDSQNEHNKQEIVPVNEVTLSEELSDVEKPFDVYQNTSEDDISHGVYNEDFNDNKRETGVGLESVHNSNDSPIIGQMQTEVLNVHKATNKNTPENENLSITKLMGIVESVCCWFAIIKFQYQDNTEKAICYRNSIALQTSSPLEQILHVGMSVAFSVEHMKDPHIGSNYRAINVCLLSSLNESNPLETHYNKNEISYKPQDSKIVSRYLEFNHKMFTYFRNQSGIVKCILSDDEGVVECKIRGICLHLRFTRDVFQPQHHTNLNTFLRSGLEVSFDAKLLKHDKISNSNVMIISIWKRTYLREDTIYTANVVELRVPFAFVAQVYNEKIFVFNRNFRSEGEGSVKLAANQPIRNYVSVGSEVKVLVQRNRHQTSYKLYEFAWTAKDCWLLKH